MAQARKPIDIARPLATAVVLAVVAAQPGFAQSTLLDYAKMRGLEIGAAVQDSHLSEQPFEDTLNAYASQIQPENEFKFGDVHPSEGTCANTGAWSWGPGNTIADYATAHGMKTRGHTFVWHNSQPSWLNTKTGPELEAILKDHIECVIAHYNAGTRSVYAWDVANEIFTWDYDPTHAATLRTTSVWQKISNSPTPTYEYVVKAFRWANAADPNALLFYNDYDAEEVNKKSDAIYNMVVDFQGRTPPVPIHGIAMQMHRKNIDLASLEANIKRFINLGLKVQISELDIRIPLNPTQADLDHQYAMYNGIANVCLKFPRCSAIQTWGLTDAHSWLPSASIDGGTTGLALPYNATTSGTPATYGKKASGYTALKDAMSKNVVTPTIDAFIRGGTNGDTNYGTGTTLELRQGADENYARRILFRFTLPAGSTSLRKAELRVNVSSYTAPNTSHTFQAASVADDTWTETGVTWNNQPAYTTPVLSTVTTSSTGTFVFDVTSFVNSEIALNHSLISLMLLTTTADLTTISSREGGGARDKPRLILYPN